MEYMKISLSRTTTLSIWLDEERSKIEKILMLKDEIVQLAEKSILIKHKISLTVEEYRMLIISLPTIESLTEPYLS